MRRIMRLLITLTAVGVMFTVLSGNALASSSSHSWTRLGGDPLVREGVHNRSGFVRLITSGKGNTAMRYAGMSKSEIASAVFYARTGQFRSCKLRYGMRFQRMSFGINGTSVDRNVTFRDSRYRRHPASAWCMDVRVGNRTVHILVPAKCGNVAVKNRTRSPLPKPKIKKPKKTKTGKIVCGPNFKLVGGNCVQQAANAEQNCKAVGGSYNNQNGLCTIVQVVGNCSNIVVVNGSGNVVSANQGGNCNNNPPSAPPSPPSPPSPPPPPPPVTPPPPTDVCPNLPGIQTSVPAGYVKDSNGNCIIPPPPTCPPGQTGTPPDCKVPPPPAQPPALSNLTQPQEVFSDGETYPNINVTASAMNGHSITVSCGAQYGSMTGSQTFTSGGVDTLSYTYTAPNTPDAAGRTENISCTVHDNTTGLNGNTVSVSFPIMKPPANP